MQSSYRVIKSNSVKNKGDYKINTSYDLDYGENIEITPDASEISIENYEALTRSMVENAKKQAESIISNSYKQVQQIEEEAYLQAYAKGEQEGYKKAYDETINNAQRQAEEIKNQASQILINARKEYTAYIEKKEKEIIDLVITIAEKFLKQELEDHNSLSKMVEDVLNQYKEAKFFVITCNEFYIQSLKNQIRKWQEQYSFKGDIFYVTDEKIEKGKVVIEKDNGKVIVDLDTALQKIRDSFMESN